MWSAVNEAKGFVDHWPGTTARFNLVKAKTSPTPTQQPAEPSPPRGAVLLGPLMSKWHLQCPSLSPCWSILILGKLGRVRMDIQREKVQGNFQRHKAEVISKKMTGSLNYKWWGCHCAASSGSFLRCWFNDNINGFRSSPKWTVIPAWTQRPLLPSEFHLKTGMLQRCQYWAFFHWERIYSYICHAKKTRIVWSPERRKNLEAITKDKGGGGLWLKKMFSKISFANTS